MCVCVSVCVRVCTSTLLGSLPHTVCYAECVVRRGALKGYCSSRWLPSVTSSALRQSSKYIGGWSSYSAVCQSVCLSVHTTLVYRHLSACPPSVTLFVHQSPVCLSVCMHTYLSNMKPFSQLGLFVLLSDVQMSFNAVIRTLSSPSLLTYTTFSYSDATSFISSAIHIYTSYISYTLQVLQCV